MYTRGQTPATVLSSPWRAPAFPEMGLALFLQETWLVTNEGSVGFWFWCFFAVLGIELRASFVLGK